MILNIVLFERLLRISEDSTEESTVTLLSDAQTLSSFQVLRVRMQCRQVHQLFLQVIQSHFLEYFDIFQVLTVI